MPLASWGFKPGTYLLCWASQVQATNLTTDGGCSQSLNTAAVFPLFLSFFNIPLSSCWCDPRLRREYLRRRLHEDKTVCDKGEGEWDPEQLVKWCLESWSDETRVVPSCQMMTSLSLPGKRLWLVWVSWWLERTHHWWCSCQRWDCCTYSAHLILSVGGEGKVKHFESNRTSSTTASEWSDSSTAGGAATRRSMWAQRLTAWGLKCDWEA